MRLRNHTRRRATGADKTVRTRSAAQLRERTKPPSLAVEAHESPLNPAQEIHRKQVHTHVERRSTKRRRASQDEHVHHASNDRSTCSNDSDGLPLEPLGSSIEAMAIPKDCGLTKRPRDGPTTTSYYGLLQTAFAQEDRIDDTNWLTSTLIDLMLWRLATQYANVHFLATDFCHLHLPSIMRQPVTVDAYTIRDVLGRSVDATSARPIVFVANVSHIHWNLLRVQFRPHAELQLFEPMGRLSSRSGISYRSMPRCVIEWLDACYPQRKSWLTHSVSAITRPQQVSGFDCGVACLLYADKCGQGQPREAINATTDQHEITTFRTELQRQLESELRPSREMNDSPSGIDDDV